VASGGKQPVRYADREAKKRTMSPERSWPKIADTLWRAAMPKDEPAIAGVVVAAAAVSGIE